MTSAQLGMKTSGRGSRHASRIAVAIVREIFGSGELLGARVIPESWYMANGGWYVNNGMMVLAPGAFILLGIIVWIQRAISGYSEEH